MENYILAKVQCLGRVILSEVTIVWYHNIADENDLIGAKQLQLYGMGFYACLACEKTSRTKPKLIWALTLSTLYQQF